MKTLCILFLYTTAVTELCWMGLASTSSCRVYPAEYAYHQDSVNRTERASANCVNYPSGLVIELGVLSEDYIHCNGTQLRLTDSELGPQSQYDPSYYYEWPASEIQIRQLLFIFPTRVNLTTITLHYYSDSQRGLPPLRFYAVPDDFNVWDAPVGIFASVQPGGEPVGRTSVNASFNINTQKILMVKAGSTYQFVVSEVEFFDSTCPSNDSIVNQVTTSPPQSPTLNIATTTMSSEKTTVSTPVTTGPTPDRELNSGPAGGAAAAVSIRELVAWLLVAILLVLSMVLLSLLLLHCLYKKRQQLARTDVEDRYEMEGNVCYEATQVKQTSGEGPHIYEAVKGGGVK